MLDPLVAALEGVTSGEASLLLFEILEADRDGGARVFDLSDN